MINNGVIEMYCGVQSGGGVTASIYYDPVLTGGQIVPSSQPIRNVDGAALRIVNTTGGDATLELSGPAGRFLGPSGERTIVVTPTGLTATANQLRVQAGIQTRADVSGFTMSCP